MHGPCASCRGARGAPCSTDCTAAVVHGSVWFSYLLSAETFPLCFGGGEGKHKSLLSRSLPPSPSRRSFSRSPFFATKMQKRASIFMHLEPFRVQSVRVGARARGTDARRPRRRQKRDFCKYTAKKFSAALTWWAKSWQLKALNLDQSETLRECVLPARSARDAGKCSTSSRRVRSLLICLHETKITLDEN